jgi:hypothetical protein
MRLSNLNHLERTVAEVEKKLRLVAQRSSDSWPPLVVVVYHMEAERRKQLAAGERIVQDWFRNDHQFVLARERITSQADDFGRRCAVNGYLEDVVRELHQQCVYRDRGCKLCAGLGLFP